MTIVFVSNCFNHHERFLCDELYKHDDVEFYFIQTIPLSEERRKLGWSIDLKEFPYCLCSYEDKQKCEDLINNCDVLIIGSAPFETYKKRINENKLSFYYCESFFKQGFWHILNPKTFITVLRSYIIPSRNKNVNMLCASAFTALDCARIFSFKDRCFRWGHFIEVDLERNPEQLMKQKKKCRDLRCVVKILWVGRLLRLKHPEMAILVANKLKKSSIPFEMEIIGTGPLEGEIRSMISNLELSNSVSMSGTMSPTEVRQRMEESDIFLFTSDHNEGWGAVLGEAMSSGCAVVAGSAIGATPFLVQHNVNGCIYNSIDYKQFEELVLSLIINDSLRENIGLNAIKTMQEEWSPLIAADRFYMTTKNLIEGQMNLSYENGPMSKATLITRRWFK